MYCLPGNVKNASYQCRIVVMVVSYHIYGKGFNMILSCQNEEQFQQLLVASQTKPIFLFKHSTRCPISSRANQEYMRFAETHRDVDCRQVLVIEQRELSMLIASVTGITHQSPQVMLFRDGVVEWNASHSSITADTLAEALQLHL